MSVQLLFQRELWEPLKFVHEMVGYEMQISIQMVSVFICMLKGVWSWVEEKTEHLNKFYKATVFEKITRPREWNINKVHVAIDKSHCDLWFLSSKDDK